MAHSKSIFIVVFLVLKFIEGNDVASFSEYSFEETFVASPTEEEEEDARLSYKASCSCTFERPTLHCDNRTITLMPTGCFSMYSGIETIDLFLNFISQISETDFDAVAATLKSLTLSSNQISYIHPKAFSKLSNLVTLDLGGNPLTRLPEYMLSDNPNMNYLNIQYNNLVDLPRYMFHPSVQNMSMYAYPNPLMSVPCSFISAIPYVMTENLHNFTSFWAATSSEMSSCKSFNLPIYVSNCRPFGWSGLDCSVMSEPLTAKKASMAVSECTSLYFHPTEITFNAEMDRLVGKTPEPFDCVPDEFDMTKLYRLYYRNSNDLVIESIYFDLLDLPDYTSGITTTVTIRADTVVLTGPLQPIQFLLKIVARRVVLEYPIKMNVNIDSYAPDTNSYFYTSVHERGRVGNSIVEKLQHGLVTVLVLQGEADSQKPCQPLPDWTGEAQEWVEASQLWLTLYCATTILERGKIPKHLEAEEMVYFVANITTDWTKTGHIGVNQKAVTFLQDSKVHNEGSRSVHEVPYMTVSVYGEMVSYLNENLQLYNEAMNNLKLKLEVNAQRMFDRAISFSERMNDLSFLQSNAEDAVDKAEAILGAHTNQLETLYQQTTVIWNTIIDVNNKLNQSKEDVENARKRVDEGMEAYKRRRRFLSFLDFTDLVIDIVMIPLNPMLIEGSLLSIFTDIVMPVGEFLDTVAGREQEVAKMAAAVDELMLYVDEILALAPPEPPTDEAISDWLQSFKDTEAIVKVATNFSVSKTQWQGIRETCMIVLDDEELSDAVDGVRQLKMAVYDLTVHGQTLSEHIIIFANLVISINEQLSVVEDEKVAVSNSQESLAEALALINDVSLTEENYLDYMISQNIALAKVMAQLYLKSRIDFLAAFNVLGEYCNAYFYTFLSDCPIIASYSDDYATMLYKLQQVDVLGLNAIGSLEPPPQPFQMTFSIHDSTDVSSCQDLTEVRCPVTQLAHTGRASVMLSEWWGSELSYTDRVRIDSLRFYLAGMMEPTVTLAINRPRLFNDTWQGKVLEFAGHVTSCLIIYEDSVFQGPDDANFITDCSTHHLYEEYYYRSTPYGIFEIEWSEYEFGRNYTELNSLQAIVEGSWVPRI